MAKTAKISAGEIKVAARREPDPGKTYSRGEVAELLRKQILQCMASIEGNLTEFTARRKVMETKLIEF